MRVLSISVRKLFGRFDYTIPLNLDERITIIHGPNGYGKTTLLLLVDAAFQGKLDTLRAIPFKNLRVEVAGGNYLEISQEEDEEADERLITYRIGEGEQIVVQGNWRKTSRLDFVTARLQSSYAALKRRLARPPTMREMWEDFKKATWVRDDRKPQFFLHFWLSLVPVHFISVQRLLTSSSGSVIEHIWHSQAEDEEDEKEDIERTVEVYSDEIKDKIVSVQKSYASKSQQLDSTFPKRVVETMPMLTVSDAELRQKFQELELQRRRLDSLGILPSEDTQVNVPASVGDEAIRKVLWLYARDVEDKLALFGELANRFSLFQKTINQRFQFKRLKFDADRGFLFESDTGQELPPTALSSGEQHQLIMIYECLFKMDQDALLLIDEPELSLHVMWQVEFLRDLQRIIQIAQFDVLIATHSPQIIHDRWDLTVELQPPSSPAVPVATNASVDGEETPLE